MNKIMFFAHLRDTVGAESIMLNVTNKTVAELRRIISDKYNTDLETVMVAINEEFAEDEELINEGDAVAFIPPVSGG
mgnify:CR=1 FL=1